MLAYNFINFDAFTNTPVYRLVAVKGQTWDNNALAMADAPTFANSLITVAVNAIDNTMRIKLPATLPTGEYHMEILDAAAPDKTTAFARWYLISWNDVSKEMTSLRDMGPMK